MVWSVSQVIGAPFANIKELNLYRSWAMISSLIHTDLCDDITFRQPDSNFSQTINNVHGDSDILKRKYTSSIINMVQCSLPNIICINLEVNILSCVKMG